ncbi:hypothetical protein EDD16DRAFT_1782316 [Pisolithus croceorrhizus]|nr:hypothetical protein EV401DRAFT_1895623 [Pisolithus croceorrhizus]KAI6122156.1 hypothetical protein EDD16DRAFT_1782316 [Pisolithus croceorrhizus]
MPWKWTGVGDINLSTLKNMPTEAPSFKNQDITFRRLVSPNKGHVASGVKWKITGGDSEPRDDKGDMMCRGNVNSDQDVYRGKNEQGNLPMSSRPPETTQKHSYEAVRPSHRCGRIKFKAGKVSRKQKGENTYQGRGSVIACAQERIGTSHSLAVKPRMWQEHQKHIRHGMQSVEALQSTRRAHTKLKELHAEMVVPDDLQRPQECPKGIRKWHYVNTNVSSQIRLPAGQEEDKEAFGVVKNEWKHRNDGEGVDMDGIWCWMDGATSSTCCDSKQVETRLLTRDEGSGQHKQ